MSRTKTTYLLAVACLACGPQPATTAQSPGAFSKQREEMPPSEQPTVSAEMGALNERETQNSFYNALDGLQQCVAEGTQRQEYLSGEIELAVLVDSTPRAVRVWTKKSTLGDRATEQCMFAALSDVTWPSPIGGPISIAENRFEFPLSKGVQAPMAWDAGRATAPVEPLRQTLEECRAGEPGEMTLTLYIDGSGQVLSSGASHARDVSDSTVACVLAALNDVQFPPPQSPPAKLRFRL